MKNVPIILAMVLGTLVPTGWSAGVEQLTPDHKHTQTTSASTDSGDKTCLMDPIVSPPLVLQADNGPVADQTRSFKLAGLKLLPVPWDKASNFSKLQVYARRAVAAGADLIVTPEGFLDGYVANEGILRRRTGETLTRERYLAAGEPMDGPWLRKIAALALELKKHLLIGFAERRGEEMYNTAVLYSPEGKVIAKYSKAHNADEPFNENGSEFPVFSSSLGRLGILVCFDRQLPEPSRILAIKGAQVILIPAFGMSSTPINEDVMLRTRAYENSVYVAHVHPRNTFVVDPRGTIIAQSRGESEEIVIADITLDERIGRNSAIRERRPDIYREILTPVPRTP